MSDIFSWRRFMLLFRKDIFEGYRSMVIAAIPLLGVAFLLWGPSSGGSPAESIPYHNYLFFVLGIGGPIIASLAFRELHDKNRNETYLLLPASPLEKVLARLLQVHVLFPLLLILCTMILSLLFAWLPGRGPSREIFNPFGSELWSRIIPLVVFQSLFFLGAAWFKKNAYIKTWLFLILFFIVSSLIFGFLGKQFLGELQGVFHMRGSMEFEFPDDFGMVFKENGFFPVFFSVIRWIYLIVLAPFCWFVAWLRVKEAQVSHGI